MTRAPSYLHAPVAGLRLAVQAVEPGAAGRAKALAQELDLPLLPGSGYAAPPDGAAVDAWLQVGETTLAVATTGRSGPALVTVDFGAAAMRHRRRGGQNELLGRAVGVGKRAGLRVLDATAGLGRDGFVLADLGCRVTLAEREGVVAALLRAALERAHASGDAWLQAVAARLQLIPGDVRLLGADLLAVQDVIYLDPMFPPRAKSAAVKKEMALFQRLLQRDDAGGDAADLLLWALAAPVARVVVKRALRAPPLAGRAASHSIRGRSVRYDVHVLRPLAQ